jgi:hypothetical protein
MSAPNDSDRRLTRDEEISRLLIPMLGESRAAKVAADEALATLNAALEDGADQETRTRLARAVIATGTREVQLRKEWQNAAENSVLSEAIRLAGATAAKCSNADGVITTQAALAAWVHRSSDV